MFLSIFVLPSMSALRARADEPRSILYYKVAKKAHVTRAQESDNAY
jgi:hypothetical protein